MKHFIKSFLTSLLIGIPLAIILCVFLYLNKDRSGLNENHEELIHISGFETDAELDSDYEKDIFVPSQEETLEALLSEDVSSVTISFAGDVHFSEQYIESYERSGISAFADDEMLKYMQRADLFVLNNEFTFTTRGEAMEDKQYTLRSDPQYVKILQELGTDIAGIANNHVLDFGQDAFLDTLDTLKNADIDYIGGGRTLEEAVTPVVKNINGQSFAFLAATRVSPSYDWYANSKRPGVLQTYDASDLNKAIKEAEKKYDHTIIFVHWGGERVEIPEEYQRTLAKGYIDAGADLVIGCHPHVLQGFEYYNGVPIAYSLGNYLFSNRTGETLLLNAVFDETGEVSIYLIPCERKNGVLTRIQEPTELFNHLTDISYNAAISHGGILIE